MKLILYVFCSFFLSIVTYGQTPPLKVFILAGQSNAIGHGLISGVNTPGTRAYTLDNDSAGDYDFLKDGNGGYVAQDDAWIYFENEDRIMTGDLEPGYGKIDDKMGLEVTFGERMQAYTNQQILIIKTAWGGRNLARDFRPPSSGGQTGMYYNETLRIIDDVLSDIDSHFPEYDQSAGYEIAGLVWHQGWSDHRNSGFTAEYTENLANLIKDLRSDIGVNFPVVVGTTAVNTLEDAFSPNTDYKDIELAQLAIANTNEYPEFEGNVTVLDAKPYWISPNQSPIPGGEQHFHWNQNAKSYMDLGFGLADALFQTESFGESETPSAFTPDPNKTYYLENPRHNLRIASDGESEDPYTASSSTTGTDVEWKFVQNSSGYWHIDRADGGSLARLRSGNSENADMQATSFSGDWTQYQITPGSSQGTYFLTLINGPEDYRRLQVNNNGDVKMVSEASNGTWESFRIIEASTFQGAIRIEAEDFDAMSGIRTQETEDDDTLNVGWIDTGDWMEYEVNVPSTGSYNINFRVATRNNGASMQLRVNGNNVATVNIGNTGNWQNWTTSSRNINLSAGVQTIRMTSLGNGYNINWFELESDSSGAKFLDNTNLENSLLDNNVKLYPVPLINELNVEFQGYENYDSIRVINLAGEQVLTENNISENKVQMNVSHLARGVYFLNMIRKDGTSVTKKFIK